MICSNLSLLRYVHLVYYFIIISFCIHNNISCFNVNLTKTNEDANIIRLNKLISMKRNISRRKSDEFIKDGKVKINNKIITNPGTHVHIGKDSLRIYDKKIKLTNIINMIKQNENKLHKWIVLHKPKGLLCTSNDEKNRKSIYTLFPEEMLQKYRLVTVGRLDRNTSGVLLLTNDYAWVNKLTHPKYQRIRTYRVHIEGPVKMNALKELARVPDPITTKMKTTRSIGPTGCFLPFFTKEGGTLPLFVTLLSKASTFCVIFLLLGI
ncbi:hypothetical protein PFFCH_00071 [Plasmodium falciparum FCH/4]|uniref:RNA-binding S4 domain-containing protein n=1 Tax=Plasmodium falciparum FCH/4 TaxID=1036724 RepID=A0A024VVZ2_PLAFA|nr:hypothetical protein PFFCH_00071 [Plasmodium falciparum FCH/4]